VFFPHLDDWRAIWQKCRPPENAGKTGSRRGSAPASLGAKASESGVSSGSPARRPDAECAVF
jgi:hypothetical protein